MKKILSVTITAILMISSCASVPEDPTNFETAPFFGMVYDGQDEGVSGATVSIDEVQVAETDINGRFVIPEMAKGTYTIVITKEEYENKTLTFDFLNRSAVLYVSMKSAQDYMEELDGYLSQSNYSKAFEAMQKGLEVAPNNPALRYLSALYYTRVREYDEAITLLQKLATEFPYDTPIFLALLDIALKDEEYAMQIIEFVSGYKEIMHNESVQERLSLITLEETE